jgi:hypothetical protein
MELLKIGDTLINMNNITAITITGKGGDVDVAVEGNGFRRKFSINDVSVHETFDTLVEKYDCFNLPVKIRMRRHNH